MCKTVFNNLCERLCMIVGYIGDVVGRPGRVMIETHLASLKKEFNIDFVVANTENASHGFGLTTKHAIELFSCGIDIMSGGNHTWDRKEIVECFDKMNIIRPLNLPKGVPGRGTIKVEKDKKSLAVINIMGHFSMPMCDNPFIAIEQEVKRLHEEDNVDFIFIDFHAEATSEKRALFALLKGQVSAIVGSHTHVGTDDLVIDDGTFYVSDVGLTGCRDNVIGADKEGPLKRFLTGLPASIEIPNKCKKILQMVVVEFDGINAKSAFKILLRDNGDRTIYKAYHE